MQVRSPCVSRVTLGLGIMDMDEGTSLLQLLCSPVTGVVCFTRVAESSLDHGHDHVVTVNGRRSCLRSGSLCGAPPRRALLSVSLPGEVRLCFRSREPAPWSQQPPSCSSGSGKAVPPGNGSGCRPPGHSPGAWPGVLPPGHTGAGASPGFPLTPQG